jgi:hypothetical protein
MGRDLEGWYLRVTGFQEVAAIVARQAGEERDASEVHRLTSIAEYWVRLAEIEDWERESQASENSTSH